MQEMAPPPDAGFVVDWQLSDQAPDIDLSMAEAEVALAAQVGAELGVGSDR